MYFLLSFQHTIVRRSFDLFHIFQPIHIKPLRYFNSLGTYAALGWNMCSSSEFRHTVVKLYHGEMKETGVSGSILSLLNRLNLSQFFNFALFTKKGVKSLSWALILSTSRVDMQDSDLPPFLENWAKVKKIKPPLATVSK